MRELAIGDIHGCARSLASLLEVIQPGKADTVVFLGDYIDRGPDSCGVLDMVLELHEKCTVVALSGNHEKMMLQARSEPATLGEWLKQGGHATLNSYALHGFKRDLGTIPERHWKLLSAQMLDYWQTERHIFVHASIDPDLELDEQPDFLLFWQQFRNPTVHQSGKQIVCGHTSQKSGWPALFEGGVCIDTLAYGGGWLTCFEATEGTFFQANERGERRTFHLRELTDKYRPQT